MAEEDDAVVGAIADWHEVISRSDRDWGANIIVCEHQGGVCLNVRVTESHGAVPNERRSADTRGTVGAERGEDLDGYVRSGNREHHAMQERVDLHRRLVNEQRAGRNELHSDVGDEDYIRVSES